MSLRSFLIYSHATNKHNQRYNGTGTHAGGRFPVFLLNIHTHVVLTAYYSPVIILVPGVRHLFLNDNEEFYTFVYCYYLSLIVLIRERSNSSLILLWLHKLYAVRLKLPQQLKLRGITAQIHCFILALYKFRFIYLQYFTANFVACVTHLRLLCIVT